MEEQGLVIAVRRQPGHVLVTVSGEIDIATAGQLRGRLAGPAGGGQQVIVDFSWVSFIDAAGAGGLQVAAAGWQVRRVLALTGLDRSIPLAASVAEARAALRSAGDSRVNGISPGRD